MSDSRPVVLPGEDAQSLPATARDHLAIMRLDHATKHVVILPGIVLATLLRRGHIHASLWPFIAGALAAVLVASANYVINEWLDRASDAHHPTKSARVAVRRRMNGGLVWLQWAVLLTLGLAAAASGGLVMGLIAAAFGAQGLIYNVPPVRSKDHAYLDVLSESVNNPLRLMLGWAMVDPTTLPPASLLLGAWLGGAFLMDAKRLSEYREIVAAYGRERLTLYRASFAGYNEISLTASCLVYALISVMALAIFFIKYRVEYILILPLIALLFGKYLAIAMHPASAAQKPETLFAEKGLMTIVALIVVMFAMCTMVDMPALAPLTAQTFIGFK